MSLPIQPENVVLHWCFRANFCVQKCNTLAAWNSCSPRPFFEAITVTKQWRRTPSKNFQSFLRFDTLNGHICRPALAPVCHSQLPRHWYHRPFVRTSMPLFASSFRRAGKEPPSYPVPSRCRSWPSGFLLATLHRVFCLSLLRPLRLCHSFAIVVHLFSVLRITCPAQLIFLHLTMMSSTQVCSLTQAACFLSPSVTPVILISMAL